MPPFTTKDANRHKKGLSAKQARQWSHVANSMYDACVKEGGSAKTCEARAIRGANGVTGTPKGNTLLTVNTALTVAPHRHQHHGEDYLIAPCVMVIGGVLNGGLVVNEALVPSEWDHVPVVVNHPQGADGQPVSARSPEVLSTCGIGHVFHTRLGQGKRAGYPVASLIGELWINLAHAQRCGSEAQQVITMLEAQQPVECSTAFYPEVDATAGVFIDGTPFSERYLRLRPDHLALLPNTVGACSIQDGCGAPRLNHQSCACGTDVCTCPEGGPPMEAAQTTRLQRLWQMMRDFVHHEEEPRIVVKKDEGELTTEQTDIDIREALQTALLDEAEDEREGNANGMMGYGGGYMSCPRINDIDVDNKTFTYYDDGRLRQRSWTVENGVITLGPEGQDVQRNTTYTVVPDAPGDVDDEGESPTTEQEETSMAAPDIIKRRANALIANARTRWSEEDRHFLERQDEAFLIRLEQQPLDPPPSTGPGEPETAEEAIDRMPAHLRETMHTLYSTHQRRKTAMIETLMANKHNAFTAEELQEFGPERLEKLMRGYGEEVPGEPTPPALTANYNGRRMPPLRIVQTEESEAPPPPPQTMDLVVQERKRMGLM